MAPSRERKTTSRKQLRPLDRTPRKQSDRGGERQTGQPTRLARKPPDSAQSAESRQRSALRTKGSALSPKKTSVRAGGAARKREGALTRSRNAPGIAKGPQKRKSRQGAGSATQRPPKAHRRILGRYLAHFRNPGLLFKKGLRNLIFYPVVVLCLYPMLVFRHHILLMVLYLYLWTNIAIAVAAFLDELFDLPRKH